MWLISLPIPVPPPPPPIFLSFKRVFLIWLRLAPNRKLSQFKLDLIDRA